MKHWFIASEFKQEKDLKSILEKAIPTPEPKKKTEFIKNAELPKLNIVAFMLQQVFYIRKMTWLISFLISVCAFLCVDYIGKDSVWVISSMLPLIALCAVTESARSKTYGMAELEQASRFSLKSVMLARMGIMSFLHFIIFITLIPFVGKKIISISMGNRMLQLVQENVWNQEGIYVRISVYLFVPYLLTSVLCLIAVRRMQGKELNYVCMGLSVGVGFLNFLLKANIPGIYEEKRVIWWFVFCIFLGTLYLVECRKVIYQSEKYV